MLDAGVGGLQSPLGTPLKDYQYMRLRAVETHTDIRTMVRSSNICILYPQTCVHTQRTEKIHNKMKNQ